MNQLQRKILFPTAVYFKDIPNAKELNKYLFKQSLIPFLFSVSVITTMLFLQFLIRAVDRFLGKGLDAFTIFEYLYLNLVLFHHLYQLS